LNLYGVAAAAVSGKKHKEEIKLSCCTNYIEILDKTHQPKNYTQNASLVSQAEQKYIFMQVLVLIMPIE